EVAIAREDLGQTFAVETDVRADEDANHRARAKPSQRVARATSVDAGKPQYPSGADSLRTAPPKRPSLRRRGSQPPLRLSSALRSGRPCGPVAAAPDAARRRAGRARGAGTARPARAARAPCRAA